MAAPKDHRLRRLRELRRFYLRVVERARARGAKKVVARNKHKANVILRKIRHRRRVLRLRHSTPKGLGWYDGRKVCEWIIPYLQYGRAHGWHGYVTSGYRSNADQWRVCNTPPYPRPCAAPGTSRHQGINYPSGAVDVSQAYQLDAVLNHYPNRKLHFAGARDPVHFSTGAHAGLPGY